MGGTADMTPFRLLLRNLLYHWRGNLAVFLGVAVGAAVLTGALLVGDSLRGSLHDLTLERLGWVDAALIGGRFLREEAAEGLPAKDVSAAVLVRGTASVGEDGPPVRQVNVIGATEGFWSPDGGSGETSFWDSDKSEVVLSKSLADAMGTHVGDAVAFRVGKASAVPPESLLGRRDASAVLSVIKATVHAILGADAFGSRFNLAPTTEAAAQCLPAAQGASKGARPRGPSQRDPRWPGGAGTARRLSKAPHPRRLGPDRPRPQRP